MAVQLPDDFKEFLKLLSDHNVEYLLIGGYAVGFYGYARATNDLDIWVSADQENVARLIEALRAFGMESSELQTDVFSESEILRLGAPPLRIEIMSEISGVKFEACYNARETDQLDGVPVSLIDLESLKENKRASGRYKDLDDLEHLD
jgi:hypothetical protein